ncbi:MAG: isoprenylcysteine carboxylmethyltransferase family protein [Candidatus Bathyarchaeota archaeon]|nr:isoprenylcysteine carboxylmethyltransferase family protein [Candidatus Bathyarchaeota archaeon]
MVKLKEIVQFIIITVIIAIPLHFGTFTAYGFGTPDKWLLIALNVIFLSLFVLFLPFKRKLSRLPNSVYIAFLVALYVEMFGIPLTMYMLSGIFSYNVYSIDFLLAGLLGEETLYYIHHYYVFPASKIIMGIGILLIIYGWKQIHKARKEGTLVTTGIYKYVRHPQYLGFLLITLGLNVQWLSIITFALWPVLVVLYWRLAKMEDKEMEEQFGEQFLEYKRRVPGFIPRLRAKKNDAAISR